METRRKGRANPCERQRSLERGGWFERESQKQRGIGVRGSTQTVASGGREAREKGRGNDWERSEKCARGSDSESEGEHGGTESGGLGDAAGRRDQKTRGEGGETARAPPRPEGWLWI
jgi:hypothetical protein